MASSPANIAIEGRPRQKRRAACATSNISKGAGRACSTALDEVAAETGAALASVALGLDSWPSPAITAPIASATSVEQLEQLLAALTLDCQPEQIARLNEASA